MILAGLLLAAALKDEFFIISSVDAAHNRIVVKRPTEVTAVMTVAPNATLRGEKGEALHVVDFRAGDTVYAVVIPSADGLTATHIRRGGMTREELRRRYLPQIRGE